MKHERETLAGEAAHPPITRAQADRAFADLSSAPHDADDRTIATLSRYMEQSQDHNFSGAQGTPLHLACRIGDLAFIDLCLERPDYPRKQQDVNKALHLVISFGGADAQTAIDHLIDAGAELTARDAQGDTTLIHAIRAIRSTGSVDIINQLLNRGADPTIPGRHHMTPLMLACHGGYTAVVQSLLEADVDVEAVDATHRRALHVAATREIVALLVDAGAQVNVCDDQGKSPMSNHLSDPFNYHNGTGALLLKNGAELTGVDWSRQRVRDNFLNEWEAAAPVITREHRLQCLVQVFAHGQELSPWAAEQLSALDSNGTVIAKDKQARSPKRSARTPR